MRKITIDSVNAFLNRQTFKRQNMSVTTSNGNFYLRLHNNIIASLSPNGDLHITDAGWQTNTTKERLNGLPNVNIHQKNFVWYLNGEEWNGNLTQIKK